MAEAAKQKGLDGIAITDHDVAFDYRTASDLSEKTGLIIIPGIEISTSNGHLVVLMPKRGYPTGIDFMEALRGAMADESYPFVPHPTDPFSHGVGASLVEGASNFNLPVEVLNASTASRFNKSAKGLADRFSLPQLGASDAHMDRAVGDAYTVVEVASPSLEATLAGIRAGRTFPAGGRTSMTTSLSTVISRLTRRRKHV